MLTPRNAGDSPRVFVGKSATVSELDEQVEDLEDYRTTEATLNFLAVDSTGKYRFGDGYELKEFVEITGIGLAGSDVVQDADG